MAGPTTEAAQVVAPAATPVAEQGLFEAAWAILGSGTSALAGWLADHGWGVIGLGILAILVTYLATELFKAVLKWTQDERRKTPREMGDDTHRLLVRLGAVVNGMWVAYSFGFAKQVGGAIGLEFDLFSGLVIGGLLNSGACAFGFHFWQWSHSETESAKRFRAILRIKSARLAKVSEEEIAEAATEKQSPAQMAELRKTLAEDQEDEQ